MLVGIGFSCNRVDVLVTMILSFVFVLIVFVVGI